MPAWKMTAARLLAAVLLLALPARAGEEPEPPRPRSVAASTVLPDPLSAFRREIPAAFLWNALRQERAGLLLLRLAEAGSAGTSILPGADGAWLAGDGLGREAAGRLAAFEETLAGLPAEEAGPLMLAFRKHLTEVLALQQERRSYDRRTARHRRRP